MEPRFENVQTDGESSFCSLWFSCTRLAEDHSWHYHPEFELAWVRGSQGTRFVGDSIEQYGDNELVLLGPNLPHCWHDDVPHSASRGPEAIVLQFRPEIVGDSILALPELNAIGQLLKEAGSGLQFRGETLRRSGDLLEGIFRKRGFQRFTALLEILDVLGQSRADRRMLASSDYLLTNEMTQQNHQRIEFIHRFVRKNLDREVSQAQVADLLGLTPAAFSRFFRKATGQTFVGFVNLLRVNEVCRALIHDSRSITDIAMSCGYRNIAHFNRRFFALKGMNPTQFRDRRRLLKTERPPSLPDPSGLHANRTYIGN